MAFNYIGTNSYEFMVPYLVMALIYIAFDPCCDTACKIIGKEPEEE